MPSLLSDHENAPPLPTTNNADGKSLTNLPSQGLSDTYLDFPSPVRPRTEGNSFDFHIYYAPTSAKQTEHARQLHERIRREFPELRIYRLWDRAIGPHPTAMFEVNVFTPQEFGALFGFLTAHRGPLSVLIHPNTDSSYRDHTELAVWMGTPWPLLVDGMKAAPRS